MGKVRKKVQPIRKLSWQEYQKMADKLAKMLFEANKKLLFEIPEMYLWGIPRGGTIVAISISHYNEQFFKYCYENPLKYGGPNDLVVVDDIVDSGDTAEPYFKKYPVASLFLREGASLQLNWYVEKIEDNTWIKFPWEKDI